MPLLQLNDAIFRDHARDRALQHQAFAGLDIALHRLKLPNRHRFLSSTAAHAVLPLGMTRELAFPPPKYADRRMRLRRGRTYLARYEESKIPHRHVHRDPHRLFSDLHPRLPFREDRKGCRPPQRAHRDDHRRPRPEGRGPRAGSARQGGRPREGWRPAADARPRRDVGRRRARAGRRAVGRGAGGRSRSGEPQYRDLRGASRKSPTAAPRSISRSRSTSARSPCCTKASRRSATPTSRRRSSSAPAPSLKVSEQRLALARDGFRADQTLAAKADAQRAAAMLKQSVIIARESEIRAPADGVILHRLAEPGQLVAAGRPRSRWRSPTACTCARSSRSRVSAK